MGMSWIYALLLLAASIELSFTFVSPPKRATSTGLLLTTLEELVAGVEDIPVEVKMPHKLQNRYLGLRHGQSMANIAGIISSDPKRGCEIHGLSNLGRAQARAACVALFEKLGGRNADFTKVVFMSSNFTRARETAEECIKSIQLSLAIKHLYDSDPDKSSYETYSGAKYREVDLLIHKLNIDSLL